MGAHAPINHNENQALFRQMAIEGTLISGVLKDRSLLHDLTALAPEHFAVPGAGEAWRMVISPRCPSDHMALSVSIPDLPERIAGMIATINPNRDTVLRARQALLDGHARRVLRRTCRELLSSLDSGQPTGELLQRSRALLGAIDIGGAESCSADSVARMLADEELRSAISTGIAALDYVLYGGLHIGLLTGILARYKVGKTLMLATIARNLEHQAIPTLMISLERRKHDMERFIAARALGIDARDLDIKSDPAQAEAFAHYLADQRSLRYVHKPGITIDELRSTIVSEVQRHGIKVVLVDYWQLITSPGPRTSREEKQAEAGQMLADLAADLDITIAITGQLNQEGAPKGSEGLLASAGMVVKLNREENADFGFLQAIVSNKGKSLSKGNPADPSLELALPGPHFRDMM